MPTSQLIGQNLKIVVRVSGGVLGLEQTIAVRGDKLTVTERGKSRTEDLAPADLASVRELAEAALIEFSQVKRHQGSPVSDAMRIEILVDDRAGQSRQISFESGDTVPISFRRLARSITKLA